MLIIAVWGIEFGKINSRDGGRLGGISTIVAEGIACSEVMIAGDNKCPNTALVQLIEFASDILVAKQFTILRDVAGDKYQLWLQFAFQTFYHRIEERLTMINHLPVGTQELLPGRTIADKELRCHDMRIRQHHNLCLCKRPCHAQQHHNTYHQNLTHIQFTTNM